ncbi:hypothetical protein BJX61DRAFT_523196 [Aspergillus egyptiacus]|nr:hypothetical protein BJX61DRAFT_523196 [Aspergillus egyptiacus]
MVQLLLRAPLRFRRPVLPAAPLLCRRSYSSPVTPPNAPGKPIYRWTPEPKDFKSVQLTDSSIRLELQQLAVEESFIRLRENCKCPRCVDEHSKQRTFRTFDIPPDIKAKTYNFDGEKVNINWETDIPGFDSSHVSSYTLNELCSQGALYTESTTTKTTRHRLKWGKARMTDEQHWISYNDYMNNEEQFARAMSRLAAQGLIFVKDIPDSREMVEKVATRMGPLRNTFYGPTWDVRKVPKAENVAYTNQFLGFHMDLMYMNEPPGYQLLHCLRNSCDGGESLFADTFSAVEYLEKNHPRYYKILTEMFLNYEYLHENNRYTHAWPVIQESPDKNELPESRSPVTHVNYSPPFQGPTTTKRSVERQKEELEALKCFANYLEDEANIFELKLNPGECVIFENRRVVHARRQFNTAKGERWLAGAYVDEDVLLSRFRVLEKSHQAIWHEVFQKAFQGNQKP